MEIDDFGMNKQLAANSQTMRWRECINQHNTLNAQTQFLLFEALYGVLVAQFVIDSSKIGSDSRQESCNGLVARAQVHQCGYVTEQRSQNHFCSTPPGLEGDVSRQDTCA